MILFYKKEEEEFWLKRSHLHKMHTLDFEVLICFDVIRWCFNTIRKPRKSKNVEKWLATQKMHKIRTEKCLCTEYGVVSQRTILFVTKWQVFCNFAVYSFWVSVLFLFHCVGILVLPKGEEGCIGGKWTCYVSGKWSRPFLLTSPVAELN